MMSQTYANRLNHCIARLETSPSELAYMTGIPLQQIKQYMRGEVTPRAPRNHVLAQQLHVNATWLLHGGWGPLDDLR